MNEWLKRDLHSALTAWTDEETLGANLSYPLEGVIAGHEEEMLEWILAGDFGLDGKALLGRWAEQASKNPDTLLAALPRVPEDCEVGLLRRLFPAGCAWHCRPGKRQGCAHPCQERLAFQFRR